MEFQYAKDNLDEQTGKCTTQQQSFRSSLSPHPNIASTINITTDTDESVDQDESNDDEKEDSDFNTLKSEVWRYATKLHNGKVKCNKCDREISCKDYSTTGLRRHLCCCLKLPSFA